LLEQIHRTPFGKAMGYLREESYAGAVAFRQSPQKHSLETGSRRISRGAAIGLFDHALGAAVFDVVAPATLVSTIDLRVDWLHIFAENCPLFARAIVTHHLGDTVFVRAALDHGDPRSPLAEAVGQFHIAPPIHLTNEQRPLPLSAFDPESTVNFEQFLDVSYVEDGLILPATDRVIGRPWIPAFHGGVIGATLELASVRRAHDWRPGSRAVSLAIRYLRPAIASEPLIISVAVERSGRSVATFVATARQATRIEKIVARAECLFVSS
jgi:acyl-coenzyme A thioesterase PaaI-like protein